MVSRPATWRPRDFYIYILLLLAVATVVVIVGSAFGARHTDRAS